MNKSESFLFNWPASSIMQRSYLERAARLAMARNWKRATQKFKEKYGVNRLKPYFAICANHVDLWTRWTFGLGYLSREDISRLLEDVVCELYPEGPRQNDIWERSGGDPSLIDTYGNGRIQWRNAIRQARSGGKVSAKILLKTMLEDYPVNAHLQHLEKEYMT